MSRIVLIEVADVAAEDALSYVLAVARDKAMSMDAVAALAQLAKHVDGIKIVYSAPVGRL